MFSGPDQKFWHQQLNSNQCKVLCVDTAINPQQDVLKDNVMNFLISLAESGRVDAWIGGPPCRSVSKLRHVQPGPAVLRGREGPERFGKKDLTPSQVDLVTDDTVLWLRFLWLYVLSQSVRTEKVGFVKETPRDPQSYKKDDDPVDYASFLAFPEWKEFCRRYGIFEVDVDQGPLGHERRKPTTLGTNLCYLKGLANVRGDGWSTSSLPTSLEERMEASRKWSSWAPGLKQEIAHAVKLEFFEPALRKMSQAQWRQHLQMDHMPFSKECVTCQKGAGRGAAHKRIVHPDTYTLSLDVCGAFKSGFDQECKEGRYFLCGVFTLPVVVKDGKTRSLAPGLEETLLAEDKALPDEVEKEPLLPELLFELEKEDPDEVPCDDMKEWESLVEAEQGVEVRNFTLLEILPDRRAASTINAVARMVAKLTYLGLPVRRLHSDRAAELTSAALTKWCSQRSILRTFTCGSDWRSNGRAENEIGIIRRGVNTLLRTTGASEEEWPLIARHIAERRGRQQLLSLGYKSGKLLPFNQLVMVTTKKWEEFQQHWRARRKKAWVRGADASMSLTSNGHFLVDEEGKYLRATDLVVVSEEDQRSLDAGVPVLEEVSKSGGPFALEGPPRHRIHGKSTMSALSFGEEDVNELLERLRRGECLASEEFKRIDGSVEADAGSLELMKALEAENVELAGRVASLQKVMSDEEQADCEKEVSGELFLKTRTYSLSEVRKDPEPWMEAMKAEYHSLLKNGVIAELSEKDAVMEMEKAHSLGLLAERIPAMGVYTRKSHSGRHKVRIVACGNYMQCRDDQLYASGLDATQLRSILRCSALRDWSVAALDITTAFLLAPTSQREVVVVDPPRIMQDLGIIPCGVTWKVTGALYGLVTSPRDWSAYRDCSLKSWKGKVEWEGDVCSFRLQQLEDANLWKVLISKMDGSEALGGYLAVYVDDLLMTGSPVVIDALRGLIQSEWRTSEIEFAGVDKPLRFCGMEVEMTETGEVFVHQATYTRELLSRHGVEEEASFLKVPAEAVEECPSKEQIKLAQKISGELLWLSGRSRPDIAVAVSRMSSACTRAPCWVLELGRNVPKYLCSTMDHGLIYDKGDKVPADSEIFLDVLSDASFSPNDQPSVSGLVIMYQGGVVHWSSQKQTLQALSTAESELSAMVDSLQAGRATRALIQLIECHRKVNMRLFAGNRAALVLASGQGGGWRTRHLRIRGRALAQAVETGEIAMYYKPGSELLADALTTVVPRPLLEKFCAGIKLRAKKFSVLKEETVQIDERCGIVRHRMRSGLGLIIVALSLLPVVSGERLDDFVMESEKMPKVEGGSVEEWSLLFLVLGVLIVWELAKNYGIQRLRKMLYGDENEMQVCMVKPDAFLPQKATDGAAGFDLAAQEAFTLGPGERTLVPTGLAIRLPKGTYGRIAPRSGLAAKYGVEVGAGVVDQDYRGEVKILLYNHGSNGVSFDRGDRVAQLIVEGIADVEVKPVYHLDFTKRGTAGFGSTEPVPMTFERRQVPDAPMVTSRLRMLRVPEQDLGGDQEGARQVDLENVEKKDESLTDRPPEPTRDQIRRAMEEVNQRAEQDYGRVLQVNRSKTYHGRVGFEKVTTEVALKSTSTLSDRVRRQLTLRRVSTDASSPERGGQGASSSSQVGQQYAEVDVPADEVAETSEEIYGMEHFGSWKATQDQPMETLIEWMTPEFHMKMLPKKIWPHVVQAPSQQVDTWLDITLSLEVEQSITIFFHGRERRKLFDFDDMILANLSYERARTTIAFFVDGTGMILVDERKGRHSKLLKLAWRGYTIFYRKGFEQKRQRLEASSMSEEPEEQTGIEEATCSGPSYQI